MNDLTVIFLTPNLVPKSWAEFHRQKLMEAIGDTPVITISKKPLDWGINLIQRNYSHLNIYKQILRGAKLAKTPYIAIAEDDTLYPPPDHFKVFRPPMDSFAYNMNRWGLFTWNPSAYFLKNKIANSTMIAPRKLTIKALNERFRKKMSEEQCGELGNPRIEKWIGVTPQKFVEFYTSESVVNFNHDYSLDYLSRTHKKRMWYIKAYDIPLWGRSDELVKNFK